MKKIKIKLSLIFLKNKAKTLEDIYNNSKYIIIDEVKLVIKMILKLIDDKAKKIISEFSKKYLKILDKENLGNNYKKSYKIYMKQISKVLDNH